MLDIIFITASAIIIYFLGKPIINAIHDYMKNHNNED